uniref:Uncharacterized protein n=1 Tax=Manihot esculenta TaxID=3983 RepID=A0A2C9WMJ4_MANES
MENSNLIRFESAIAFNNIQAAIHEVIEVYSCSPAFSYMFSDPGKLHLSMYPLVIPTNTG